MARYTCPKEKIERRLGAKLFLKGERSLSPKSATVKRPYPPGQHGKRFKGKPSEFALQLKAKQKVRNMYRLLEKQFKNAIKDAIQSKEETREAIVRKLETRLDNAVYRAGLGQSRDQARQLVTHGHILVNGKKVAIPSYAVKKEDVISVREGSLKSPYFTTLLPQWIQKYDAPEWLLLDKNKLDVKIKGLPAIEGSGLDQNDINSIIEFYSR